MKKYLHYLSNEQIEKLEESAAEKNDWSCCYDIVLRVDGAPGPDGTMESYVTETENGSFFYNGEYFSYIRIEKIKRLLLYITTLRKLKNFLKAIMGKEIIIWNTLSLVALTQVRRVPSFAVFQACQVFLFLGVHVHTLITVNFRLTGVKHILIHQQPLMDRLG